MLQEEARAASRGEVLQEGDHSDGARAQPELLQGRDRGGEEAGRKGEKSADHLLSQRQVRAQRQPGADHQVTRARGSAELHAVVGVIVVCLKSC